MIGIGRVYCYTRLPKKSKIEIHATEGNWLALSQEAILRERLLEVVDPGRKIGIRIRLDVPIANPTGQL
jgi:hypothetical protein